MHILTSYALLCGAKIDKPYIFENYFPVPFDKYITFQAQTKFDSKDYDYHQVVINLIFPFLEKYGIKIVQFGGPNEIQYKHVIDLRGKTDLSQLAYIIKNSLLHYGSDSLGVHVASSYDIPIVGLYSASSSVISGPFFGTKEKQICFDAYKRHGNGKPSYSDKEFPKSINLIKPEEIANSILKLLDIKERVGIETFFTGQRYNSRMFREMVPTTPISISNPEIPIEIRMDLNFDENVLAQQLSISKGVIVTNKRISTNLLLQFKLNIAGLVYVIDDEDEPSFIEEIRNIGIPITLISYLSPEEIDKRKINYYETGLINQITPESQENINKIKENIENLYFVSNKILLEKDKIYMTNLARITNQEIQNDFAYYKLSDCPELWRDISFLNIVKIKSSGVSKPVHTN